MYHYCNNSGAIAQANEPRSHKKSKHLLQRYHLIHEIINRGDVKVCKVHKEQNVADPLMKIFHNQSMRCTWGPWVLDTYMRDLNVSRRLVSWLCLCTIWIIIIYINYQVCDLFVKFFVDYEVILNNAWSILLCETYRLAHVLIDDHISWIIDMGISNYNVNTC
jgi:hypothetical protein